MPLHRPKDNYTLGLPERLLAINSDLRQSLELLNVKSLESYKIGFKKHSFYFKCTLYLDSI